jgi:hypothetical protein
VSKIFLELFTRQFGYLENNSLLCPVLSRQPNQIKEMLTTTQNPSHGNSASDNRGTPSQNCAKGEKLTVYYYVNKPDQFEQDLIESRKEAGYYD